MPTAWRIGYFGNPDSGAAPAPHFAFMPGAPASVCVDCKCIYYSLVLYLQLSISAGLFSSLSVDDDGTAYLDHKGAGARTARVVPRRPMSVSESI